MFFQSRRCFTNAAGKTTPVMAELPGFDKAGQIRRMNRPLERKLPHLAVSAQLRQKPRHVVFKIARTRVPRVCAVELGFPSPASDSPQGCMHKAKRTKRALPVCQSGDRYVASVQTCPPEHRLRSLGTPPFRRNRIQALVVIYGLTPVQVAHGQQRKAWLEILIRALGRGNTLLHGLKEDGAIEGK